MTTTPSAASVATSSQGSGDMKLAVSGKLECMKCKKEVAQRSDFLLVSEKEDWCNALWGWCLECSGLSPEEFKKQQRKQWKRRQTDLTGILRQRGMEFHQLCQVLLDKFPGTPKRKLFEAACHRVHSWARLLHWLHLVCTQSPSSATRMRAIATSNL